MNQAGPVGVQAYGFIGLGQIGRPMAERLLGAGPLVVHDVNPAAVTPLVERGVTAAATPADVAREATLISVVVRDDEQVNQVLFGPEGVLAGAAPGTVVAVHATVHHTSPPRWVAPAAERGVEVVDAPVSGGATGAAQGRLVVMAGGSAVAVERLRVPWAHMAQMVAHLGPVGAGTRAKLARNLVTYASMVALEEAYRLAAAGDVDLHALRDVVRRTDEVIGGPGNLLAVPGEPVDPDAAGHLRALGGKDLSLALDLAGSLDEPAPVTELTRDRWSTLFDTDPPGIERRYGPAGNT